MHGSREPSNTDWYLSIQVDLSTSGVHHMSTSQNDRLHFAPWWSIGILSIKDKYVHERLLRVHLFSQVPAQNVLILEYSSPSRVRWDDKLIHSLFSRIRPCLLFWVCFLFFQVWNSFKLCQTFWTLLYGIPSPKSLWLRRLNLGG